MSGSICHDPSGFHRSRNFPDPVRGLCAVPVRHPLRRVGAVVLAAACHCQADAGIAAAGGAQPCHACAFQGEAELDLRSRPSRQRQVHSRSGKMSDVRVLDGAPWLTSGPAARALALLNGDGEEARVVGGAVRNALLKLPIGDIDIATTALPGEVVRRARLAGIKSVPTGIEHGTVTLVIGAQPFEVTTLREDVETFGRKAKVVFGRDWV